MSTILPLPPLPGRSASSFVSCSDAINWAVVNKLPPNVARLSITKKLIGPLGYLAGKNREEQFYYERNLINAAGTDLHLDSEHKPLWQHMCTFIQILWPETDIAPSTADAVRMFCWAVGNGRKGLNLIGCQNSSKSATTARLSMACLALNADFSKCTVANPYNNTSDSTIWGDIQDLWSQMCVAWPKSNEGKGCSLFPEGRELRTKEIILKSAAKAGSIRVTDIKEAAKVKGGKTRKSKGEARGFHIYTIDEVNEVKSSEFLLVFPNISSQDRVFLLTSQNFTDKHNMGGELVTPSGAFGGPDSFEDLDIETSQAWDSAYRTVTLRFDGHKMPNVVTGKIVYSYLLKQADLDRIAETGGGVNGDSYMSQIRSFPAQVDSENKLLSDSRERMSMCEDTQFTMIGGARSVAFLDPAFGGRDRARLTIGELGTAVTHDGAGRQISREFLVVKNQLTIPVVKGIVWDSKWNRFAALLGVEPSGTPGQEISPEDQLAIDTCATCRAAGVVLSRLGYDFSMRDNIVTAMNRWSKFSAVSFNYNGPPLGGVTLPSLGEDTKAIAADRVTELNLIAAEVFATKQLRGGDRIPEAIIQLKRTEFLKSGTKKKVEKKIDYKARNGGVSPDDRDSFVGMVAMAIANGFRLTAAEVSAPGGTPVAPGGRYGLISSLQAFKASRIPRPPY